MLSTIVKLLTWVKYKFYKKILLYYIVDSAICAHNAYLLSITTIVLTCYTCFLSIISIIRDKNYAVSSILVKTCA